MSAATLLSIEEYLNTSFHPDREYIDGEVIERNVGKQKHSYAQSRITMWFGRPEQARRFFPLPELRSQVTNTRVRIPDVTVVELPLPEEEILTSPPWLCIEIMSPDDTMASMQDRIDDYIAFGISNIWVIDPWKNRGWTITDNGWTTARDLIMRTHDGRVAMPLADVLLR